jgi:hypothetical protein
MLDESAVFPCPYHSIVALHTHISPTEEQQVRWWAQLRDVVSPHRHGYHHDQPYKKLKENSFHENSINTTKPISDSLLSYA